VRQRDDCGRTYAVELGGVRISCYELDPGYRKVKHVHEQPGVVLMLHGVFAAQSGRRVVDCSIGYGGILAPGFGHAERAGAQGAKCLLVEPANGSGPPDASWTPRIIGSVALVSLARRLWFDVACGDRIALADGIEELWLELRQRPAPAHTVSGTPPWIHRVVELLRTASDANLSQLVREADVTREHLARTFRRHTGVTIGEFRRRLRVARAAARLVTTDRPLSEVATHAGFADQSHMTRIFQAHYGATPARYRQRRGEHAAPL
jgi:AraC-like DNA-binding protein